MLSSAEKSRDSRRSVRAKVRLLASYVSESLVADGLVTDVSADGLFFCSDYLDGAGEMVRITLIVPWRTAPLELRGEVRWVSDSPDTGGMGIKLFDVSLDDRRVLSSLVLTDLADTTSAAAARQA